MRRDQRGASSRGAAAPGGTPESSLAEGAGVREVRGELRAGGAPPPMGRSIETRAAAQAGRSSSFCVVNVGILLWGRSRGHCCFPRGPESRSSSGERLPSLEPEEVKGWRSRAREYSCSCSRGELLCIPGAAPALGWTAWRRSRASAPWWFCFCAILGSGSHPWRECKCCSALVVTAQGPVFPAVAAMTGRRRRAQFNLGRG